MKSLNQVTIMGNLTRDPELKETPNGQKVCNFTVALSSSYKDKQDQWQEKTEFIDCVAWSGLAENIAKWLTKGRPAIVSGRLQTRSWEQDGQKRSKMEVLASDVIFIGTGKTDDGAKTASAPAEDAPEKPITLAKKATPVLQGNGDEPVNLDDIPF